MQEEDIPLDAAMRGWPGTPEAARWRRVARDLDEASWTQLRAALDELAFEVAARHRDLVDADALSAELLPLAVDRWIPEHLVRLERGKAHLSVRAFLAARLEARLARRREEQRRTDELRSGEAPRLAVGPRTQRDERLERVLALGDAGFGAEEIRRLMKVVDRREGVGPSARALGAGLLLALGLAGGAALVLAR